MKKKKFYKKKKEKNPNVIEPPGLNKPRFIGFHRFGPVQSGLITWAV
jgi:hypothetical protein